MTALFKRRTSSPGAKDPWWIKTTYNGYNHCILIDSATGSVLSNCVAYCHGRWGELAEEIWGLEEAKKIESRLCLNNAENYWNYTQDGFSRSQEPHLGDIIVWRKGSTFGGGDGAGHVAIIEHINRDSNGNVVSIETSASNYSGTRWYTSTYKKSNKYFLGNSFTFLGFIHFPCDFYEGDDDSFVGTPVNASEYDDQIKVDISILNARKAPNGDKWGKYVRPGYYNVKGSKVDGGYTWYHIQDNVGDTKEPLWCALVDGVTFVKALYPPIGTPVAENKNLDQIKVEIDILRGRKGANGDPWGRYVKPGLYNVLESKNAGDYLWYHIENNVEGTSSALWCAQVDGVTFIPKVISFIGTPVKEDNILNQVKVTSEVLRGRKGPNGEAWGRYVKPGFYNVLASKKDGDYLWYCIEKNVEKSGQNLWCALVDGVEYKEGAAGEWQRKYDELAGEYEVLKASDDKLKAQYGTLEQAKNDLQEKYDTQSAQVKNLNSQVSDLKAQNDSAQKQIVELDSAKKELESTVVSVKKEVASLEEQVNIKANKISAIKNIVLAE